MELFDVGVVAEAVRPPTRDEVHAVALHFLQQLPAAIGCASELGRFLGLVFGFGGVIVGCDGDGGDGAEIRTAIQLHGLI